MVFDPNKTARMITRAFPGWRCFYGPKTRKWWGVPPSRHPIQALFEGDTPADLAALIHRACTVHRI
ncbi:MAG: hypothetical protein JWL97_4203 [Gemmatimonadales bacterium]|jgi:hypothetical protein|nr:hypothetical protein [Gemmatimonadales bacterium]